MRKILDIPYYSEFGDIDGSCEHINVFKRRSCGIVSVKMVVDYYRNGKSDKVTLKGLIKTALKHRAYILEDGGKKKNFGWVYTGIVKTLEDYGFRAWRRHFLLMPEDISCLKKEGTSGKSLNCYRTQVFAEVVKTFKDSIDAGNPILVSIIKNLGRKQSPHLVVVTGYEETKGNITGFYINDPNNPKNYGGKRKDCKNQLIPFGDFCKTWRKTAIFVEL